VSVRFLDRRLNRLPRPWGTLLSWLMTIGVAVLVVLVFQVAQAEQLLASGYWVPTALPGTVPGATNLGGYHLACNPPTGVQHTGQYVGDGGDVVDSPDAAPPGYYPVAGLPGS